MVLEDNVGRQYWKINQELELEGNQSREWQRFLDMLKYNFINLSEEEDRICWCKNPTTGDFTIKFGIFSKVVEEIQVEKKWWWELIWKFHGSLKTKIALWLALENKLLTWDNDLKRDWVGPSKCALCKQVSESIHHLEASSELSLYKRSLGLDS